MQFYIIIKVVSVTPPSISEHSVDSRLDYVLDYSLLAPSKDSIFSSGFFLLFFFSFRAFYDQKKHANNEKSEKVAAYGGRLMFL